MLKGTLDRNNLSFEYLTHFGMSRVLYISTFFLANTRVCCGQFDDDFLHKLICNEGYYATKYSILRNVRMVPQ